MELILWLMIAIFVMAYRYNTGDKVYKFFADTGSNREFDRWLNHVDDLFSISIDLQPVRFEGIDSINLFVNAFDDDHNLTIGISVNSVGASRSDIMYNNELIYDIENELIPDFVQRFNSVCDLSFPTVRGSFEDFLFLDEEFYLRVATKDYVNYESPKISVQELKLTGKFREEF